MLEAGEFDVCTLVYNRFRSVITPDADRAAADPGAAAGRPRPRRPRPAPQALYEYEPAEEEILATLLPRNLAIQIYRALLENAAGFYGSQMTAMDNATRNAGDMINKLTLNYNRTRQANITRELIEIISGRRGASEEQGSRQRHEEQRRAGHPGPRRRGGRAVPAASCRTS